MCRPDRSTEVTASGVEPQQRVDEDRAETESTHKALHFLFHLFLLSSRLFPGMLRERNETGREETFSRTGRNHNKSRREVNGRGDSAPRGLPPLPAPVDVNSFRVKGIFQETSIRNLRAGSRAISTLMASPGAPIEGRVDSLDWKIVPQGRPHGLRATIQHHLVVRVESAHLARARRVWADQG
jgi:hypothetical protein